MEAELRALIGKYGMKEVSQCLEREMHNTYVFLSGLYGGEKKVVKTVVVQNTVEPVIEAPMSTPLEIAPTVTETPVVQTEGVKEVVITAKNDPKAMKLKQKEDVDAKKKELEAKGIKPETLLTKENLEKWIGQGYSYSKIARETGCPDTLVTAMAKAHGLQSKIGMLVMSKMRGSA